MTFHTYTYLSPLRDVIRHQNDKQTLIIMFTLQIDLKMCHSQVSF